MTAGEFLSLQIFKLINIFCPESPELLKRLYPRNVLNLDGGSHTAGLNEHNSWVDSDSIFDVHGDVFGCSFVIT